MATINEITPGDINQLDDIQLTRLLRKLLYLEAISNGINNFYLRVPLEINVPDGGEDGNIEWVGIKTSTNWLPINKVCFQIKAKSMGPEACYEETLNSEQTQLKPKIKEILDKGGAYIIFCNHRAQNINNNVSRIRDALQKVGRSDFLTALVKFYDNEDIASWVNQYSHCIFYTNELLGREINNNFKTWDNFIVQNPKFQKYKFIDNDFLIRIKTSIQEIIIEEGKIFRLVGLSGLGKTRLIYEVFNEKELSNLFIYYDSNIDANVVIEHISLFVGMKKNGFIVIDNCNLKLHDKIKSEITNSKISVLTIDNNPKEINRDPYWLISPKDLEDVIESLIKSIMPYKLNENQIARITEFSQGFPLIAVLLAENILNDKSIGEITDIEIIRKLIGVNDFDNDDVRVLQACSIFDNLGYYNELEEQRNAIAINYDISRLSVAKDLLEQRFYEICEKYIERGIIDRRGRYIFVKPKPLALHLAAVWWKQCRKDKILEILDYIIKNNLSVQLMNQLEKLDFLPKAKEIIITLNDINGPFDNAEVLNTELGSRLFCSMVEVNPEITCNTLERLFLGKPKNYLIQIKEGRRNIVWALEKLCWRKTTFNIATKILFDFAVAENETWGNNATGVLKQLFHIHLSGTEASLLQRFEILKWSLNISNEHKALAIKVLGSALENQFFTRDSGFEYQGTSKPLKDYRATYEECLDYWSKCLNLLLEICKDNEEYKNEISEIIADSIRGFIVIKASHIIFPVINELSKELNYDWPDGRSSLKKTLKYERKYLSEETINSINELIILLTPADFEKRFKMFVANPGFDEDLEWEEKPIDMWKINSEKEAELLLSSGEDWRKYIRLFYEGSIIQGYDFGYKLGELFSNTEVNEFIDLSLCTLRDLYDDKQNFSVLIGFLNGLNDIEVNEKFAHKISSDIKLKDKSFLVFSHVKCTEKMLNILLELVISNTVPVTKFLNFKYYKYFDNYEEEFLTKYFNKISSFGDTGSAVTFLIINNYLKFTSRDIDFLHKIILNIFSDENLLINLFVLDPSNIYEWSTYIIRNYDWFNNMNAIESISKQLLNYLKSEKLLLSYDHYIQDVLLILFEKHFSVIWPRLGELLLSSGLAFLNISHIIGYRISYQDNFSSDVREGLEKRNGILFHFENDALLKWCREFKPEAPILIAKMLPIFKDNNRDDWHPFAIQFIDEFGDDENVLQSISGQMGSYSWVGSTVDLFSSEKLILEKLINHKNDAVKNWAKKEVSKLESKIARENIDDQERFLNL